MMLPVMSSDNFVYIACKSLLLCEYIDCRIMPQTTAKSLVSYLWLSTIYSDDSSALHVMVYKVLKTTAQVASFVSPPCL